MTTSHSTLLAVLVLATTMHSQTSESAIRCTVPAARPAGNGQLVVVVALDATNVEHRRFRELAEQLARDTDHALASWAGVDEEALLTILRQRNPRSVQFVVAPEFLDVNVHRRALAAASQIDTDPFVDVPHGWLVARNARALEALIARTRALHARAPLHGKWMSFGVISSSKSFRYADGCSPLEKAAGFAGATLYAACIEQDPDVRQFLREHLPELDAADVLSFTGNGDPQGIWLFDDHRNVDASKHWPYAKEKVLRADPVVFRLLAQDLRQRKLGNPIVWSGTCHSAIPRRVFVENDIVSTFGHVDRVTLHELDADDSMCLALIDAGATALLAPIGPNHGLAVNREQVWALTHGATLGDAVRSTWHDVVATSGLLPVREHKPGEPFFYDRIMQVGGTNRLLIGDPDVAPFRATAHPGERMTIDRRHRAAEVRVDWDKEFHAWEWDMYGIDHARDFRIVTRVALDELGAPALPVELTVTACVEDADGQPLPHKLSRCIWELDGGRRYVWLQANAPRAGLDRRGKLATFSVGW